jgi:GDPmannose 4,6-dehydratase
MITAIITGIGQDGYFLSKKLLKKGYRVIGVDLWQSTGYRKELKDLLSHDNFELIEGDISDRYLIRRLLRKHKPEYFYNMAAISHVGVSFEIPIRVTEVNYLSVIQMLEEIKEISPKTKFLQASTSEQFGENEEIPQNEKSNMIPTSPYAIAKTAAFFYVRLMRKYGLKTFNTISHNHESPIRPENFVSRKITKGLVDIKSGLINKIELGNIESKRDWGFAGDFCDAMIIIMENSEPDDYVLSTGQTRTVRDFIEIASNKLGMKIEWKGKGIDEVGYLDGVPRIFISEKYYRPSDVAVLMGDSTKIMEKLGWTPTTTFDELVEMMILHDLNAHDI